MPGGDGPPLRHGRRPGGGGGGRRAGGLHHRGRAVGVLHGAAGRAAPGRYAPLALDAAAPATEQAHLLEEAEGRALCLLGCLLPGGSLGHGCLGLLGGGLCLQVCLVRRCRAGGGLLVVVGDGDGRGEAVASPPPGAAVVLRHLLPGRGHAPPVQRGSTRGGRGGGRGGLLLSPHLLHEPLGLAGRLLSVVLRGRPVRLRHLAVPLGGDRDGRGRGGPLGRGAVGRGAPPGGGGLRHRRRRRQRLLLLLLRGRDRHGCRPGGHPHLLGPGPLLDLGSARRRLGGGQSPEDGA